MTKDKLEDTKRFLLSCCALMMTTTGTISCSILRFTSDKKEEIEKQIEKQTQAEMPNAIWAFLRGMFKTAPLIGNVSAEYLKAFDETIINQKKILDTIAFNDVVNNQTAYIPTIQALARLIVKKADETQSNIEYVIPGIEKDFIESEEGQTYGDRMKSAVRILLDHFSIVSKKFSEKGNRKLFLALIYNKDLCAQMPLINKNDDVVNQQKNIIKLANMVSYPIDILTPLFRAQQNYQRMLDIKKTLEYAQ